MQYRVHVFIVNINTRECKLMFLTLTCFYDNCNKKVRIFPRDSFRREFPTGICLHKISQPKFPSKNKDRAPVLLRRSVTVTEHRPPISVYTPPHCLLTAVFATADKTVSSLSHLSRAITNNTSPLPTHLYPLYHHPRPFPPQSTIDAALCRLPL